MKKWKVSCIYLQGTDDEIIDTFEVNLEEDIYELFYKYNNNEYLRDDEIKIVEEYMIDLTAEIIYDEYGLYLEEMHRKNNNEYIMSLGEYGNLITVRFKN